MLVKKTDTASLQKHNFDQIPTFVTIETSNVRFVKHLILEVNYAVSKLQLQQIVLLECKKVCSFRPLHARHIE